MNKLSIVTVCFNSSSTIQNTLESVNKFFVEAGGVDYVVIDGASTDNTLELVNDICPFANVVSEEDNGIYDAMNKGIKLAKGDYILLLNSDDEICAEPRTIIELLERTTADFITFPVQFMSKKPKKLSFDGTNIESIPHTGLIVSKKAYEKAEYNVKFRYAADLDFILRNIKVKNLQVFDLTIVSMSPGGRGESLRSSIEAVAILIEFGKFRKAFLPLFRIIKKSINYRIFK